MKLLYLGNFRDPGYEGLITVLSRFKSYFSKKYTLFVNDLSKLERCDLVHIHSSGFFAAITYKKLDKPIIYSLYSNLKANPFRVFADDFCTLRKLYSSREDRLSVFSRRFKQMMRFLSYSTPLFLKRLFLQKMDVVVLPNRYMDRLLRLKNSVVIHQGTDVNKFRKKKVSKKGLSIRYFGHPTVPKGFLEVVEAFSALKGIDKGLFITSTNSKLRSYVKEKDSSIQIKGLVKDIVKEYNKSDIIVLPYRHGAAAIATPLTLIEAMACECAIITTNLPHIKEICGDSVVYVDPYAPEQIVKAVERLKSKRVREQLGRKARKRIVRYYSDKDMLDAYDKLYKRYS